MQCSRNTDMNSFTLSRVQWHSSPTTRIPQGTKPKDLHLAVIRSWSTILSGGDLVRTIWVMWSLPFQASLPSKRAPIDCSELAIDANVLRLPLCKQHSVAGNSTSAAVSAERNSAVMSSSAVDPAAAWPEISQMDAVSGSLHVLWAAFSKSTAGFAELAKFLKALFNWPDLYDWAVERSQSLTCFNDSHLLLSNVPSPKSNVALYQPRVVSRLQVLFPTKAPDKSTAFRILCSTSLHRPIHNLSAIPDLCLDSEPTLEKPCFPIHSSRFCALHKGFSMVPNNEKERL